MTNVNVTLYFQISGIQILAGFISKTVHSNSIAGLYQQNIIGIYTIYIVVFNDTMPTHIKFLVIHWYQRVFD